MKTIFVFIFFFFLSFVFVSLSQKQIVTQNGVRVKFNKYFFILSFFCLFFLLFNKTGADYNSYIYLIGYTKKVSLKSVEPLFSILCIIFNFIFKDNYAATYFMLTALALVLFYWSFFLLRNDVNLSYCLLAFELFAFCRFYLVSMHLASALILLSFVLLFKNKTIWGLLTWAMAALIHTSGFFLVPLLFVYIITKRKKKITIKTLVIITIPFILLAFFSEYIYRAAVQFVNPMKQYSTYGVIQNYTGTGIMEYIIYVPLFYYFFRIYQQKFAKFENRHVLLFFLATINGFLFSILGYRFEVISRMYEFFMVIYILIIPLYLQKYKDSIISNDGITSTIINNYSIEKIFFVIYIVLRGLVISYSILRPDSTSQIMGWEFYWPF